MALFLCFACLGGAQEFGASLYSRLSWVPDEGFYVSTDVDADLDFEGVDLGVLLKVRENEFSKMKLDFTWYERPLRLVGETVFESDSQIQGHLRARYWEDPWQAELKATLSTEEPFLLEFLGTYENAVEVEWYCAFNDTPSETKLTLNLPLSETSTFSLAMKAKKDQTPSLTLKWKGWIPWGDLTLEFHDFAFYSGELTRKWAEGRWEYEFDLYVDAEEPAVGFTQDVAFYQTPESGYGFSFKIKQSTVLELKRLHFCLFGPAWELCLKLVAQEISFQGEQVVGEDLLLHAEVYLYLEEGEWEASIWLDGALSDWSGWTLGTEVEEDGIKELYWELYLEV